MVWEKALWPTRKYASISITESRHLFESAQATMRPASCSTRESSVISAIYSYRRATERQYALRDATSGRRRQPRAHALPHSKTIDKSVPIRTLEGSLSAYCVRRAGEADTKQLITALFSRSCVGSCGHGRNPRSNRRRNGAAHRNCVTQAPSHPKGRRRRRRWIRPSTSAFSWLRPAHRPSCAGCRPPGSGSQDGRKTVEFLTPPKRPLSGSIRSQADSARDVANQLSCPWTTSLFVPAGRMKE